MKRMTTSEILDRVAKIRGHADCADWESDAAIDENPLAETIIELEELERDLLSDVLAETVASIEVRR